MTLPPKLRPARSSDAASLAALSIEIWIGTYLREGVSSFFADFALQTFTIENLSAQISDPNEIVIVSENSKGLDGYLRLSLGSAAPVSGCAELEISTLYVQPRHHGKGIGAALLRAAITEARALSVPSLWLTTNAENAPAIAFYQAKGFAKIGETHFKIKDERYLNDVLRLDLPPQS